MRKLGRMSLPLVAAVFTSVAAMSSLSGPARAEDGPNDAKRYPGSMCVRWAGPQPVLDFSSIYNPSNSAVTRVDCPIVKDRPYQNMSSANVRFLNRHPTQLVSCYLTSVVRTTTGWTQTSVLRNAGPGLVTLAYPAQARASDFAHWYFSCSIPPRSTTGPTHLLSYYTNEN